MDPNEGNKLGVTPLAQAVRLNRKDVVQFLLEHPGVDVNRKSNSKETPLSEAVRLQIDDIINLLCKCDRLHVEHENWQTAKKQEDMFESSDFYALLVRLAATGENEFDINKRNSAGHGLLHMAVLTNHEDGIEHLCKQRNFDFKAKSHDGKTAFDLIFPKGDNLLKSQYLSIVKIAHKTGGKDVVRRKDSDGRTVIHIALELLEEKRKVEVTSGDSAIEDMLLFFLTQPGVEVEIYEQDSKGIFQILEQVIQKKGAEKIATKFIPQSILWKSSGSKNPPVACGIPFIIEKLFDSANDEQSILDELRRKIGEDCGDDIKLICSALLNIIIIGLQQNANHERLQYILYKGSVFKTLVQIFVDLDEDTSTDLDYLEKLLRVLYISTQANINCDCVEVENPSKIVDEEAFDQLPENYDANVAAGSEVANESNGCSHNDKFDSTDNACSRTLAKTLGGTLLGKFRERITEIAESEKGNIGMEVSNVQLIARGIYNAYFQNEDALFHDIRRTIVEKYNTMMSKMRFSSTLHKCFCRGDFAIILCLFSIFMQSSDIVSDALVGFKTMNGFSKQLGILMIFLVLLTLVHENIRSVITAYETDRELLRISLGKIDLVQKDLEENSKLNYYCGCNWILKGIGQFFWTFKVNRSSQNSNRRSKKAILFNLLSISMLRPVVDRLIVATHSPSHLRAIYRQQSKQKSLNQYFMILEQIPELLIQFYVFQIYFNILKTSEDFTSYRCTDQPHSFTYKSEYFHCVQNLLKLKICASWYEIYSMLVPFFKIPDSMVSLEKMFRILSPETPKMSSATSWTLYLAYTLMIPSRLFLLAAVLHSVPNQLYVAVYLALATIAWMIINICTIIKKGKTFTPNSSGRVQKGWAAQCLSTTWSLSLFTIRDLIVISLRRPDAYLLPSSDVNYESLRDWKRVLAISSYFFVEGVVGAVYVENNYPCGRNTDMFKYQGWLYLITLIISVTIISLLSFILQPTKINIIPYQFLVRAGFICSLGFVMWLLAAGTFTFTTTNKREDILLPLIFATLIILSVFLAVVIVLKFFSEAKQNKSKVKKDILTENENGSSLEFISSLRRSHTKHNCPKCKTTATESDGQRCQRHIQASTNCAVVDKRSNRLFRLPVFLRRRKNYKQVVDLESADPARREKAGSGCLCCCANRTLSEDETLTDIAVEPEDQQGDIKESQFHSASTCKAKSEDNTRV